MDSNESKKNPNLSHEESLERLELYQKTTDDLEHIFHHKKLEKEYLEQKEKTDENRVKQDVYYGQGVSSGLPHNSHEDIQHDREIQDQNTRNQFMNKAKEYYDQNHSLAKEFDQAKSPDKDIDI